MEKVTRGGAGGEAGGTREEGQDEEAEPPMDPMALCVCLGLPEP